MSHAPAPGQPSRSVKPPAGSAASAASLMPGVIAATAFACADVLGKVVFAAGGDVLTLLSCRSLVGLVCIAAWLRLGVPPGKFSPRDRWIALGLGLLFAATVFGLFEAIDLMDVPTARSSLISCIR